jgi:hypothetical protein
VIALIFAGIEGAKNQIRRGAINSANAPSPPSQRTCFAISQGLSYADKPTTVSKTREPAQTERMASDTAEGGVTSMLVAIMKYMEGNIATLV